MKISKKMMALVAALGVASSAVVAKMEFVSIDSSVLIQESKRGKALKAELESEAQGLQKQQQELISDLQKAGQEFQKKSKLLSKSAQEAEITRLQKMEKKAQRQLQEASAEFQESAKLQQEELHRYNLQVAANLLEEKEWGMMVEKGATVAVNKSLDVTTDVLNRLDEEYERGVAHNASEEIAA